MTLLDASSSRPLEGGPSFSLRNRLMRVFWQASWVVLCRFTPPPMHAWRAFVLRRFGARVGRRTRIYASVHIWWPANLEVGDHVVLGPDVQVYNQGRISIGASTVVSQRAHLCASTHDITDPHFQLVLRPIAIGERCWIATEALVGPGVTIGDRAVLAARGALFGNAEPGAVYSGNPATFLKKRDLREGV